jgi:hypothetical protein
MPCRVQRFPHRRNRDGSYDSICTFCFATVASSGTEEELGEAGAKHICDRVILYQDESEKLESK